MTTKEWADRIWNVVSWLDTSDMACPEIEKLLQQMVEEAVIPHRKVADLIADHRDELQLKAKRLEMELKEARAQALEEAAQAAESGFPMNTQQMEVIAEKIRGLR